MNQNNNIYNNHNSQPQLNDCNYSQFNKFFTQSQINNSQNLITQNNQEFQSEDKLNQNQNQYLSQLAGNFNFQNKFEQNLNSQNLNYQQLNSFSQNQNIPQNLNFPQNNFNNTQPNHYNINSNLPNFTQNPHHQIFRNIPNTQNIQNNEFLSQRNFSSYSANNPIKNMNLQGSSNLNLNDNFGCIITNT